MIRSLLYLNIHPLSIYLSTSNLSIYTSLCIHISIYISIHPSIYLSFMLVWLISNRFKVKFQAAILTADIIKQEFTGCVRVLHFIENTSIHRYIVHAVRMVFVWIGCNIFGPFVELRFLFYAFFYR